MTSKKALRLILYRANKVLTNRFVILKPPNLEHRSNRSESTTISPPTYQLSELRLYFNTSCSFNSQTLARSSIIAQPGIVVISQTRFSIVAKPTINSAVPSIVCFVPHRFICLATNAGYTFLLCMTNFVISS